MTELGDGWILFSLIGEGWHEGLVVLWNRQTFKGHCYSVPDFKNLMGRYVKS